MTRTGSDSCKLNTGVRQLQHMVERKEVTIAGDINQYSSPESIRRLAALVFERAERIESGQEDDALTDYLWDDDPRDVLSP